MDINESDISYLGKALLCAQPQLILCTALTQQQSSVSQVAVSMRLLCLRLSHCYKLTLNLIKNYPHSGNVWRWLVVFFLSFPYRCHLMSFARYNFLIKIKLIKKQMKSKLSVIVSYYRVFNHSSGISWVCVCSAPCCLPPPWCFCAHWAPELLSELLNLPETARFTPEHCQTHCLIQITISNFCSGKSVFLISRVPGASIVLWFQRMVSKLLFNIF